MEINELQIEEKGMQIFSIFFFNTHTLLFLLSITVVYVSYIQGNIYCSEVPMYYITIKVWLYVHICTNELQVSSRIAYYFDRSLRWFFFHQPSPSLSPAHCLVKQICKMNGKLKAHQNILALFVNFKYDLEIDKIYY